MFKVNKKYSNANIGRTVRFTDELYERLSQVAQDEGVSFNFLVLECCKYALDDMEPKEDPQT